MTQFKNKTKVALYALREQALRIHEVVKSNGTERCMQNGTMRRKETENRQMFVHAQKYFWKDIQEINNAGCLCREEIRSLCV